jgi:hypothetical protein
LLVVAQRMPRLSRAMYSRSRSLATKKHPI